jgi:hypothetical protein
MPWQSVRSQGRRNPALCQFAFCEAGMATDMEEIETLDVFSPFY